MAQALKHYENLGEARSLSSSTTHPPVDRVEKKLAAKHLQNKPSYTLRRNQKVYSNHYQKN